MPPARHGRNTQAYRKKAARLKKTGGVCWICGDPIDPTLDYRHKMSGTADHVIPLATGGHILGDMLPAHRGCNSSRGTDTQPPGKEPTSRDW